jgi:hypothetical protein
MACSLCTSHTHNLRKCPVPVDATPEQLHEIMAAEFRARGVTDGLNIEAWGRLPEWFRKNAEYQHDERMAKLRKLQAPKPAPEPPPVPAVAIEEKPTTSEKRIVIVTVAKKASVNAATTTAIAEGAPEEWTTFIALERGPGVRLAIAMRAHHVVFCEDTETDKAVLRPYVDRLHLALPGVHVVLVYGEAHEGQTEKDIKTTAANAWINPAHPRFKSVITGEIAQWEPEEKDVWTWQPWTPATRAQLQN